MLRKQLLEPAVLQVQRFDALDVSDFRLPEVLAPGVDRGSADLGLLGGLGHRGAFRFAQDRQHLLFRESTLLMGSTGDGVVFSGNQCLGDTGQVTAPSELAIVKQSSGCK